MTTENAQEKEAFTGEWPEGRKWAHLTFSISGDEDGDPVLAHQLLIEVKRAARQVCLDFMRKIPGNPKCPLQYNMAFREIDDKTSWTMSHSILLERVNPPDF